jgi:1-acyl-sn-glycerol-3-phosphate acyltransferase
MSEDDGARASGLSDEVLRAVGEVLGRDGPPPDDADALAALGFDSLSYAEFGAVLSESRGIDLLDGGVGPIGTIAELVATVERAAAGPGDAGPLMPVRLGTRQRFAKRSLSGAFRRWFDLRIEGAELMPATGPVILCMNHESILDIPAVAVASTRPITFMAKRELFRHPTVGRAFGRMGAFSVDRELFDLRAIRIGLEVVRGGEVLGMYPEGTRKPGTLLPFLPGAPWLALVTGAALLPCAISGTERALPRGHRVPRRVPIGVTFLPPIEVEPIDDPVKRRTEAERLANELRDAIAPLLSY